MLIVRPSLELYANVLVFCPSLVGRQRYRMYTYLGELISRISNMGIFKHGDVNDPEKERGQREDEKDIGQNEGENAGSEQQRQVNEGTILKGTKQGQIIRQNNNEKNRKT